MVIPLSKPSTVRRWSAAAAGVVLMTALLPHSAQAAPRPSAPGHTAKTAGEELANFDSRAGLTARPAAAALQLSLAAAKPGSAVRKLRDSLGVQGIVDIDKATGTPRRVARLDGYLTAASKQKPEAIARAYLTAHADVFGLDQAGVAGLTLRQDYVDVAGIHHLSFTQSVGGVTVFGNGVKAHIAKDGRLISIDGSPLTALPATAGSATLTAASARAQAVGDVFGHSRATVRSTAATPDKATSFTDGGNAKLVLIQTAAGPTLAWQTLTMDEGYLHVIDAAKGAVMLRQSIKANDTGSVWTNYPGAPKGGVQKKTSLTKWLPNDSPRLAGNVAHVWSDVNDDNLANPTEEVAPAARRSFDFPFTDFSATDGPLCSAQFQCSWDPDTPNSWQVNRGQNAVQMFSYLGTWHDHLAADPIGFTRTAGNFEAVDGDAVQGQSDDGANTANGLPDRAHIDNANMSTPPDGTPPVMQMYLFVPDPGTVAGNSGDAADVVFHEYTHGLSNRLVVDANGVSTLGAIQAGAMGEAWSDWYALDYLINQGLEKDTKAPGEVREGKYLTAGSTIRSEPTDCPVGSTSADCPGTPAAGPGGYTYGDYGLIAGRPEVHADGEIWAQTLWDLRDVIGSSKAESLVTRAMELSPSNPSFLDERNSILQADLVVNGGKLQKKIWQVFAKRGMGYFAAALDGDDAAPVEDFSLPPAADTPRGALTGRVVDSDSRAPAPGVTVGFGGHASSFAGDYQTVTGADGTYAITGIIPGTYAKVFARGTGYDVQSRTLSISSHTTVANWSLRRDWASAGGGGTVTDFNGLDGSDAGCGPASMIDQSQGSGWSTDAALTGANSTNTAIQPRFMVIKLPATVNVTEIDVNPSATCGDGGSASTGDYRVETSPDGTAWTVVSQGHFTPAQRAYNPLPVTAGGAGVRYVRYTMLGTQTADVGGSCPGAFSGCNWVDSSELGVYGTPAS